METTIVHWGILSAIFFSGCEVSRFSKSASFAEFRV